MSGKWWLFICFPQKNLTLLQVFVKKGVFNDIWLDKGNWSMWHNRIDCATRKTTFNMRQWGAVHVTYSFIFLLQFNLMRVYLCVFADDSVSEQKAQLRGGVLPWLLFPQITPTRHHECCQLLSSQEIFGSFKYFFRCYSYHNLVCNHKAIPFISNLKLKKLTYRVSNPMYTMLSCTYTYMIKFNFFIF